MTPQTNRAPKPWLAALVGFINPSLGFLYLAAPRWAGIYLLASIGFAFVGEFVLKGHALVYVALLAYTVGAAAHCYQHAQEKPQPAVRPWYSRLYSIAAILICFCALIIGIRAFMYEPFSIPSGAMEPSIRIGQHVIVKKWGYGNYSAYGMALHSSPISATLQRGDVIVFEYPMQPSQSYIKRLIGLPGDTVSYRDKQLNINGKPVSQSPAGERIDGAMQVFSLYDETLDGRHYQIGVNPQTPAFIPEQLILDFAFRDRCRYDASGLVCKVPDGHYFVLGDSRDQSADSRVWGFVPAANIVGKVAYSF